MIKRKVKKVVRVTSFVSIIKKAETQLNHCIVSTHLGGRDGDSDSDTRPIWNWPWQSQQIISRCSGFVGFVTPVRCCQKIFFSVSTHPLMYSHSPRSVFPRVNNDVLSLGKGTFSLSNLVHIFLREASVQKKKVIDSEPQELEDK